MSNLPRIDGKETLHTWLETRPRDDAVTVAHRAAMRVAPIWIAAMADDWASERDLTPVPVLRLNLTSGVARKYPTPEVRAAAYAATSVPVLGWLTLNWGPILGVAGFALGLAVLYWPPRRHPRDPMLPPLE